MSLSPSPIGFSGIRSPGLRTEVEEWYRRLEAVIGRLYGCRVGVERQGSGRGLRLRLEVALEPGHKLVVTSEGVSRRQLHESLAAAWWSLQPKRSRCRSDAGPAPGVHNRFGAGLRAPVEPAHRRARLGPGTDRGPGGTGMDPEAERQIELMNRRKARKSERYYLDLQPGECALLEAASRIYAARIAAGRVGDQGDDGLIAQSVHEAAKMADCIERSVKDVEEQQSLSG